MSKDIRINKYFYIILLCILFVGAHIVSASESFKNSLIRMEFSKISGGVQVKLYTNKPYGDSVSVIKKSDSEYVILMPETSNSMTANPILNPVAGVVRGVSVKTQQYADEVKGYTKITISTLQPIEIVPQVKTINASDYQLSENDYSELLAQAAKKAQPSKAQPPIKKKAVVKSALTKKETVKIAPKIIETKTAVQEATSKPLPKKNKTIKAIQKQSPVLAVKPKTFVEPKVVEVPKSPVREVEKPVSETVVPTQIKTEEAQTKQVQTPPVTQVPIPTQAAVQLTLQQKIMNIIKNPSKLGQYKNLLKNNFYGLVGIIALVFILLLLGARRMTRGLQKEKEAFTMNLDEKPVSSNNFMDKINKNMTWKEKYQTYVESSNQPNEPSEQPGNLFEQSPEVEVVPFEATQELNELFATDDLENDFAQENPAQDNFAQGNIGNGSMSSEDELEQYSQLEKELLSENEIPQNEISRGEDTFGKDKLDELFGVDEDIFGEESGLFNEDFSFNAEKEEFSMPASSIYAEEAEDTVEESVETIKSEYVIDDTKGFYLVDYQDSTALIGHIEDEIFVLKQFQEKIEGTLQARLDEHKGSSANYMTRVGKFKALVEVKPNDMNLLIEL